MIALVFCGDIKYCPYIKRYIEILEKKNSEYYVFFWNRGGFDMDFHENYMWYDERSDLRKNKVGKILDFINFKKWIVKQFEIKKPNKIIVLSTLTGVLLENILRSYRRKYIFDIRDYSYEYIRAFYLIESKVINNSFSTTISSEGFKAFLPNYKYIIAHNLNRGDLELSCITKSNPILDGRRIKYVWNGVMRYFEFQKQFIDALKNDDRFEMIYYGDGPELSNYKNYCEENQIGNVIFKGAYNNSEKQRIMEEADMLNNCYGYTRKAGNKLKYAVSNKYYDGIIFRIPQVVEGYGYKTELVKNYRLGIAAESAQNFGNLLFEYFQGLDYKEFNSNCVTALSKVLVEDDIYINMIDEFIDM